MEKWNDLPTEDKMRVLEELVDRVARQMAKIVDDGEHSNIYSSIIVSNGDLDYPVGMFRLDDDSMDLFDIGIVAQGSGIETNLVVGVRVTEAPELWAGKPLLLVVHGFITDGDGIGFFNALSRDERGILRRSGALHRIPDGEDIGKIEEEMIIPFLKGRYHGRKLQPDAEDNQHSKRRQPKRSVISADPGSFWIEIRK